MKSESDLYNDGEWTIEPQKDTSVVHRRLVITFDDIFAGDDQQQTQNSGEQQ